MRSEEVLRRLTDGIPEADTLRERLHAEMRSAPEELLRIQDLVQLMLSMHTAILKHGGSIQEKLELRRARLFSLLAPELSGPHQGQIERPILLRPKNARLKPVEVSVRPSVRLPDIKTIEEAERIILEICEAEGLSGPEAFTDWRLLVELGRKYPRLDQAIAFVAR